MSRKLSVAGAPQLSRRGSEIRTRYKGGMLQTGRLSETASSISAFGMREMGIGHKLENTYKMAPEDDKRFNIKSVSDTMRVMLTVNLSEYEYDAKTCGKMTCQVANKIKQAIKELDFPRYKFVCNVVIGQNCEQGLQIASRGLGDSKTDSFATATYRNGKLFAVAVTHGCYYE